MDLDFRKILIAVDDSPYSERAAQAGFSLALLSTGEVIIVHVVDITVASGDMMSGAFAPEIVDSIKESGKQLLETIVSKYGEGVNVMTELIDDRPVQGILEIAKQWKPDLIVMGTHGRTGLDHLLMGSVAEQVVRKSACPVMVVPGPKNR